MERAFFYCFMEDFHFLSYSANQLLKKQKTKTTVLLLGRKVWEAFLSRDQSHAGGKKQAGFALVCVFFPELSRRK